LPIISAPGSSYSYPDISHEYELALTVADPEVALPVNETKGLAVGIVKNALSLPVGGAFADQQPGSKNCPLHVANQLPSGW
jgi:hypothetical protein